MNWSGATSTGRTGGAKGPGDRPGYLIDLQNTDASGKNVGDLMAKVDRYSSPTSWTDKCYNCQP